MQSDLEEKLKRALLKPGDPTQVLVSADMLQLQHHAAAPPIMAMTTAASMTQAMFLQDRAALSLLEVSCHGEIRNIWFVVLQQKVSGRSFT